jgi:hypothetical protein
MMSAPAIEEEVVDELLAALWYKGRSYDMEDVGQNLEQLEMATAGWGRGAPDDSFTMHLAIDTMYYNPSGLAPILGRGQEHALRRSVSELNDLLLQSVLNLAPTSSTVTGDGFVDILPPLGRLVEQHARALRGRSPRQMWHRPTYPLSPYQNEIPEHLLLEGNQRIAGKNEPIVLLQEVGSSMKRALALGRSSTRSVHATMCSRPRSSLLIVAAPNFSTHAAEPSTAATVVRLHAWAGTPVSSRCVRNHVSCRTAWNCRHHGEKRNAKSQPVHGASRHHFVPFSRTRRLLQTNRKSEGQWR